MCLCKGTGKVHIDLGWGIHFATCPDTNCRFDRKEAMRESGRRMDRVLKELEGIEFV